MRHPLVFFRTGEKESGVVVGTEGRLKMGAVQFPDVGGGNDEDFSGAGREKFGEARNSTSFNYDGVGSLGGRDLKLGHLFHFCIVMKQDGRNRRRSGNCECVGRDKQVPLPESCGTFEEQ